MARGDEYEGWITHMLTSGAGEVWRVYRRLCQSPSRDSDPMVAESLAILEGLERRYGTITAFVQAVTDYPLQWRRETIVHHRTPTASQTGPRQAELFALTEATEQRRLA